MGCVGQIFSHHHAQGILDLVGAVGVIVILLPENDTQRTAPVAQARIETRIGGILHIGIAVDAVGHQHGVACLDGLHCAAVKGAVAQIFGALFIIAPTIGVFEIPHRHGRNVVVIGRDEINRSLLSDVLIHPRREQQIPEGDPLVVVVVPVVLAVGGAVFILMMQIGHRFQISSGIVGLLAQAAAAQGEDILRQGGIIVGRLVVLEARSFHLFHIDIAQAVEGGRRLSPG